MHGITMVTDIILTSIGFPLCNLTSQSVSQSILAVLMLPSNVYMGILSAVVVIFHVQHYVIHQQPNRTAIVLFSFLDDPCWQFLTFYSTLLYSKTKYRQNINNGAGS